jgi:hypothetical protein
LLKSHYARIGLIGCIALTFVPTVTASNNSESRVEIDPGLYQYNHVVKIGPQVLHTDDYQYCIFEDNNSRTLSELLDSLSGEGECTVSNVSFGGGKGSADVSCDNTELGFPVTGTLTANYTRTQYDVTAVAQSPMGGPQITVLSDVKRLKACPPDWTPPEGISPD